MKPRRDGKAVEIPRYLKQRVDTGNRKYSRAQKTKVSQSLLADKVGKIECSGLCFLSQNCLSHIFAVRIEK